MPAEKLHQKPVCPRCGAKNDAPRGEDRRGKLSCVSCSRPFMFYRHTRYTTEELPENEQPEKEQRPDYVSTEDLIFPHEARLELKGMDNPGQDGWNVVYRLWPDVRTMRETTGASFMVIADFHALRIFHTEESARLTLSGLVLPGMPPNAS